MKFFILKIIKRNWRWKFFSNDQTIRSEAVEDFKKFNPQSLATQCRQREQPVGMMPAIEKSFDLLGDDIVELSTKNVALKNKRGSYDENWLEESKTKLLKQNGYKRTANSFVSRMKKQTNKL